MNIDDFLSETISVSDCRRLREVFRTLTSAPMITKGEFNQIMRMVQKILERLEKENEID